MHPRFAARREMIAAQRRQSALMSNFTRQAELNDKLTKVCLTFMVLTPANPAMLWGAAACAGGIGLLFGWTAFVNLAAQHQQAKQIDRTTAITLPARTPDKP